MTLRSFKSSFMCLAQCNYSVIFTANRNNEILANNNNNIRPPSLPLCFKGNGKQRILLCWP